MKIIVLLSGGIDSAVLLWSFKDIRYELAALSVNYGQTRAVELNRANAFAAELNVPFHLVDLSTVGYIFEAGPLASGKGDRLATIFGALAGALARRIGFEGFAICSTDESQAWSKPGFTVALERAISVENDRHCSILRRFTNQTKAQIVRQGFELGVPLHLAYSCLLGNEVHCGRCEKCVTRRKAFIESQVSDLTIYANEMEQ